MKTGGGGGGEGSGMKGKRHLRGGGRFRRHLGGGGETQGLSNKQTIFSSMRREEYSQVLGTLPAEQAVEAHEQ